MHLRRSAGRGIPNANPIRIRPAIGQASVVIQPRLRHRAGPLEDPKPYFADVLTKLVSGWPLSKIDELLPWAWVQQNKARLAA
jgi:IS66 C-terminal element